MSNRRRPRRRARPATRPTQRHSDSPVSPADEKCSCGCGRTGVIPVEPDELVDCLEATRTADHERLMLRSLRAEADGDPQSALNFYLQTPHIVDGPRERGLRELLDLGDTAPPWVFNRWIVRQSYLWMLCTCDPRTDAAVSLTLAACYEVDDALDPAGLVRLGTLVAASDWVCAELAVHAMGGLRDYVDLMLGKRLVARSSMLRAWLGAPLRPFRHDGHDCGDILATDLSSGQQARILDIGAMAGADVGQHVLGRVVPIEQTPGLMFETRPLRVDPQTAVDAAASRGDAGVPGWLCALADGVDSGRVPTAIGRVGGTPLTSDVPYADDESPAA